MEKVNLAEKLATFSEHWSPKIVGELDDYEVKLVKIEGDFVWHRHAEEDELFYVVKGGITIRLRAQPDVVLREGQLCVVPKGVEHSPESPEPSVVLLFEPRVLKSRGD